MFFFSLKTLQHFMIQPIEISYWPSNEEKQYIDNVYKVIS